MTGPPTTNPEEHTLKQRVLPHNPSTSDTHGRWTALKHGQRFAVLACRADINPDLPGEQGLYDRDTRALSHLALRLSDAQPLVLHAALSNDGQTLTCLMTNPDLAAEDDAPPIARGDVLLRRECIIDGATLLDEVVLTNHARRPLRLQLCWQFEADFADMFEVRGIARPRRGHPLPPRVDAEAVTLGYRAVDGVEHRTCLRWSRPPDALSAHHARFTLHLPPRASTRLALEVRAGRLGDPPARGERLVETPTAPDDPTPDDPTPDDPTPSDPTPGDASHLDDAPPRPGPVEVRAPIASPRQVARARLSARADERRCRVRADDPRFERWLQCARGDLDMLVTRRPEGPIAYAGLPWFCTVFGRDATITALQTLWLDPSLARGTLRVLAALQADAVEPERDAEPGKIIHEQRDGEMARAGEVPFGRYYGAVDTTPLFVMLAGAYLEATDDLETLEALWPAISRAVAWIERHGDRDGDGFIEHARSTHGLVNQGWKDAPDAIIHADGRLATGDIALCEVQGYTYAAWRAFALILARRGDEPGAARARQTAARLRARFAERFWDDTLGCHALALDGDKQPCRVRSSNAGQCLLSGIVRPDRARLVAQTMLSSDMFSGWGVRTLSRSALAYSPISYHRGSVWPHDTAMIALGLSRYGMTRAATRLTDALFDASLHLERQRLPELLCGFDRVEGQAPTPYPSACSPQAWASGAVMMLLQASLGLRLDAARRRVVLHRPRLPDAVRELTLEGLRVGAGRVDLVIHRRHDHIGVSVERSDGGVEVVLVPGPARDPL